MQSSFMQAGPLSPSSGLFSYDAGESQDDLFKYYLDVQAFQGKGQDPSMGSALNNGTTITHPYASMEDSQTPSNTAYNAFFNPALYAQAAASSLNTLTGASSNGNGNASNGTSTSPSASSNASLFPFADASQYMHNNMQPSPSTVDPSALLSAAHLNGSNNPINPSLLMSSNNSNNSTTPSFPAFQQQSISPHVPAVKLEEDSAVFSSLNQQEQRNNESDDMDANEEQDDDDDDDSEDEDDIPLASVTRTRSNAPSKRRAATKANATNKKTASSSTRSTTRVKESSVLSSSGIAHAGGHASHPHALVPVPEWEDRLSKQEYDKLSSKEKRQMRNKISARNFRHRRKAHIDTLEALVSEKEGVIDVLREEVGTLRTENSGLRADIEMLKKNWESIAAKISASVTAAPLASTSNSTAVGPSNMTRDLQQLSPDEDDLYGAPGSLPALSPAASTSEGSTNGDVLSERSFEQPHASTSSNHAQVQANSNNNKRNTRSSNTIRPNLRKDVGRSGASFSSSFGGGRAMNVHTTLVPELTFNFPVPPDSISTSSQVPSLTDGASRSSNSAPSSTGSRSGSPPSSNGQLHHSIADYLAGKRERDSMQTQPSQQQRMNMNPALNGLTPEQIANLREQFFNSTSSSTMPNMQTSNSNAQIASGKIAQRSSALALDPLQQSFFDANPFLSLRQDSLQDYRAQLYAKLANNVAGIQAQQQANASSNNGQASAPVNGLRPAFFSNQITEEKTTAASAEIATIATIAQKTLFDKLSTAFWDAFAGPSPASQAKSMIPPQPATAKRATTPPTANVDSEKVADVLAGRSRLQVVKNEQQAEVDELVSKIDSLGLKK